MKITAMMVFWDERADVLREWAKSAAKLADHIVAADGPYALFEHTKVRSSPKVIAALRDGAQAGGATIRILQGKEWAGQTTKRDAVIKACAPTDWVFWMDADERIKTCDRKAIVKELESTHVEAFLIRRITPFNPDKAFPPNSVGDELEDVEQDFPRLYRYYEDMAVVRRHWCYIGRRPGGLWVFYWEGYPGAEQAITEKLQSELLFEHLQTWRKTEYRNQQLDYQARVQGQVGNLGEEL